MPQIKEVIDSKAKLISSDSSDPGYPSVKEMRDSQKRGSEGIGLNEQSYSESLVDFNMSPGVSTADDSDSSLSGNDSTLPWLR